MTAQRLLMLVGQRVEVVVLPAAEGWLTESEVVIEEVNVMGLPLPLCGGDVGSVQTPLGPVLILLGQLPRRRLLPGQVQGLHGGLLCPLRFLPGLLLLR